MDSHRYHPTAGLDFKLYHVVDPFHDSTKYWDPLTGLTAPSQDFTPVNEKELIASVVNHFYPSANPSATPSIYVPVVHRQHLQPESLSQRVVSQREKILVLEIDVEKITPAATIYTVRDLIAGRKGPWVEDPREEEWMKTYLILHGVPKEAVTVYETPKEFLTKGGGFPSLCLWVLIEYAK